MTVRVMGYRGGTRRVPGVAFRSHAPPAATPELSTVSAPSRVAAADEGIGADELALATRNHGMPLEAMRAEVTPPGLHYVLVHYDIPWISPDDPWPVSVHGLVRHPLNLDIEQLRAMPSVTHRVTLECAGNGRARLAPRPVSQPWLVEAVGTADWTGVPLRDVLAEAGVLPAAAEVVFTGADHGVERGTEQDFQRSLPLADALRPEVLLAYAMNGAPLPPQHGSPLRLVAPGWYGMAQVKWLRDIHVVDRPFAGYQQAAAYRMRQDPHDPGEPVTRMAPRALLVPPGFPDFMSRVRVVRPGPVRLEGRAWSGTAPITSVELSTDGLASWTAAALGPEPEQPWTWRAWHADWVATPGTHVLAARATDAHGRGQPLEQPWNLGGFCNNAVQRVTVVCVES
ncbi:sulfite oxidase [Yinghuangia seranimata]|uniref:sulfite oxidase n=1 Tax=Yinghuangia seranimata TaxID=408067 RepID=UPI00248AEC19|nr:sulfite oxidase [Yinghuangia seranimata]MDI2130896.1 sulfite oxidase [Yinghuangia seranimata]